MLPTVRRWVHQRISGKTPSEQGSAVTGFLFTSLLLTIVLMGLLQLVMIMHTRVMLIDIAGEAARIGGRYGGSTNQGITHAQQLLTTVPGKHTVTATPTTIGGRQAITVNIAAELPILGPYGIPGGLKVQGSGFIEEIVSSS